MEELPKDNASEELGVSIDTEVLESKGERALEDLLRHMRENYGNFERDFKEYESSGHAGEIENALHDKENKKLMLVRTDTGAIVPEGRDLLTERLSGCVGLYLRGPGFKYLVHLTPSNQLGYYNFRFGEEYANKRAKEIVKGILSYIPDNIPREEISAILVVNEPNEDEDSPYGRKQLTAAWDRLEKEITNEGVLVTRKELPLDQTAVLFSSNDPNNAYAIGGNVEIGKRGEYIFHPKELSEAVIPLSGDGKVELKAIKAKS